MKKLYGKRWARVLSILLFFLLLAGALAASAVIGYGRQDNWYRVGTKDFSGTIGCQDYVRDGTSYVYRAIRWLSDPTLDSLGSYAGDAFSYVVRDGGGNITADTRTEDSVLVISSGCEGEYHIQTVGGLTVTRSFSVEGYVNLPVEPYEGCYAEYAVFDAFFGLRYLMIAMLVLCAAGAILCLTAACLSFAYEGRQGRLKRFQRLPADAAALVCLLAAAVVTRYFRSHLDELLWKYISMFLSGNVIFSLTERYLYGYCYHFISRFIWCSAFAFIALLAAGQLGGRRLYQNLLARRAGGLWLGIAALAIQLYLFIRNMTVAGLVTSVYFYLMLAYDVLLLVGLLLWAREAAAIRKAARSLAGGDLRYKTKTGRLHFVWQELGQSLNSIGDGMTQAVEERMRSERLKTELITNVSHDLKTPLTSIINYVELLKNDGLDEQTRKQYLDVLDHQSAKLKKLTEDVVEASKAASGVMPVNREPLNAGELLEQSVGEYSARLRAAGIKPVVHTPEGELFILADSALLGRVLENLLTNILKYAQPGTRAYFDVYETEGNAVISAKNVSSAPLNISAQELMERFVRGDSSRHSEGSGLGLSIAKSLTELMGGVLTLTLDGDLFKAEVSFAVIPAQEAAEESATPQLVG